MPPRDNELRKDFLLNRWVYFAPDRAKRPQLASPPPEAALDTADDPFAAGNESETPPEVFAIRDPTSQPNRPGWEVRIVPNRYPATDRDADFDATETPFETCAAGFGIHEVVIETPESTSHLTTRGVEQLIKILSAYRDRGQEILSDPRVQQIVIFKNHGRPAGATIPHTHSQIIGLPFVPRLIHDEQTAAQNYFDTHGKNIFADMLEHELDIGERIVLEDENIIACCPYASRFPCELLVIPRHDAPDFFTTPDDLLANCAAALQDVLLRLEQITSDGAYNIILHTSGKIPTSGYRWHLEIYPRLAHWAGFELGSECYINPVFPEESAKRLLTNK